MSGNVRTAVITVTVIQAVKIVSPTMRTIVIVSAAAGVILVVIIITIHGRRH